MANREIDKLIAEKVMGWELKKLDTVTAWIDKEGNWTLKQMWKPTTDIRDAMEILSKFYDWSVFPGGCWVREERSGESFTIFDESESMAICLVALRAKGVDISESSK